MRALLATVLLGIAIPMNASAAICLGYSDYNSKKCKIPLCALRPGGFSTSECHGPLALMAWRAFWGKPPIPLPPSECGCNWIPPLLIPTDRYGVPLSVTKEGSNNYTPFNKVQELNMIPEFNMKPDSSAKVQYSQANTSDPNGVMVFEQGTENEKNDNEPLAKSNTTMSATEKRVLVSKIMATQDDFFTTCNDYSFRRNGRSNSCYTLTKNSRTDIAMRHSSYRRGVFGKRRHKYDYVITTRSRDHSNPTTEIRMRIDHDNMTYCQRFVGGSAVTNTSCGVNDLNRVVTTAPSISDPTVPGFPIDIPRVPGGGVIR